MQKWFRLFCMGLLVSLIGFVLQACGEDDEEPRQQDDVTQGSQRTITPTVATAQGLQVGDVAPAFTLPATDGSQVSLTDYVGQQPVLLYFHMAVG